MKSKPKTTQKKQKGSLKATLVTLPGLKFLNEVDSELKKVTWPDRKQVVRLSVIVIAASLFIGVYLGLLDLGFTQLMAFLIELNN